MKSNMLDIFLKSSFVYYNFINRNVAKYILVILVALLFLSFLCSSYVIFLNYENIFFRKVFYFYSEHGLISDLRYLKEKNS